MSTAENDPLIDQINSLDVDVPSDEEEEVTTEEAQSAEIKESAPQEEPALQNLVCDSCLELNLRERCTILCKRCGESFCFHYASNVDADYCVNCMSDVSLTKQIITKSYESTSPITGETHYYRRRARDIKIGGLDWLFAQRKIPELSDAELDLAIEYHRAICGLIATEQERRKVEAMHKLAGVKVVIAPASTNGTAVSTKTTIKKTKVISKDKATEQLTALLKSLAAQGISADAISAMFGKK